MSAVFFYNDFGCKLKNFSGIGFLTSKNLMYHLGYLHFFKNINPHVLMAFRMFARTHTHTRARACAWLYLWLSSYEMESANWIQNLDGTVCAFTSFSIPLGDMNTFSLHWLKLGLNSSSDLLFWICLGNKSRRRKTLYSNLLYSA